MNASLNQPSNRDGQSLTFELESPDTLQPNEEDSLNKVEHLSTSINLLLNSNRSLKHHPKAGLNPAVDAASHLFSVIGKLKEIQTYRHLNRLQSELLHDVNTFQNTLASLQTYHTEFIIVCRYILCATIDETIMNTAWGDQNQWDNYSLLATLNQDVQHQDKFFTILKRAIKEPAIYIDLMELMYLCLSMGYKGQYRTTEHHPFQLEQITDTLYKHIRAYRGSINKTLTPNPLKVSATRKQKKPSAKKASLPLVFIFTACTIMTIFVSLGYLMDIIANEASKNITQLGSTISQERPK
jgi:type VI secretion system protein ImpK